MYKIEKIGECFGIQYIVKFLDGGWRCGYAKLPEGFDPEYIDELNVHGGITFNNTLKDDEEFPDGHWVGFDCMHAGDKPGLDDVDEVFGKDELRNSILHFSNSGHYWTFEEVEAECKRLCQQIADLK